MIEEKDIAKVALRTGFDVEYIKNIAEHCRSKKEFYKYFEKEIEKQNIDDGRNENNFF